MSQARETETEVIIETARERYRTGEEVDLNELSSNLGLEPETVEDVLRSTDRLYESSDTVQFYSGNSLKRYRETLKPVIDGIDPVAFRGPEIAEKTDITYQAASKILSEVYEIVGLERTKSETNFVYFQDMEEQEAIEYSGAGSVSWRIKEELTPDDSDINRVPEEQLRQKVEEELDFGQKADLLRRAGEIMERLEENSEVEFDVENREYIFSSLKK
ncbi:MAG: hypothetical protein H8Z69_05980 [Nanohaloarchaea archaeon]|nr:hypothetical protein [Candidatus Nanohaloarchaea archaeon]